MIVVMAVMAEVLGRLVDGIQDVDGVDSTVNS